CYRDWSSDVCSSDLAPTQRSDWLGAGLAERRVHRVLGVPCGDRRRHPALNFVVHQAWVVASMITLRLGLSMDSGAALRYALCTPGRSSLRENDILGAPVRRTSQVRYGGHR